MLILAIFLFLLAAAFGLSLLTAVFQDMSPKKIALIGHGAAAGFAIVLLVTSLIIYGTSPLLIASSILFIIAALGGLTLFVMGRKQMKVPRLLVLIHPLVAVVALIILVSYVLP